MCTCQRRTNFEYIHEIRDYGALDDIMHNLYKLNLIQLLLKTHTLKPHNSKSSLSFLMHQPRSTFKGTWFTV